MMGNGSTSSSCLLIPTEAIKMEVLWCQTSTAVNSNFRKLTFSVLFTDCHYLSDSNMLRIDRLERNLL